MITNDIAAIRADQHTFDQVATDSRRADARPVLAAGLAARVAGLCDEIEQLRAENAQLRAEHRVLERAVMDSITAHPLPDVEQVIAARPALPYRSHTIDGLSGITVRTNANGEVMVDGLAHTSAAAIELSAAIARAARQATDHQLTEGAPS